ncbi:CitMHS family transporter [Paracoccus pantotrophus]|uniref:CitMHS family transporter n=1 Tax=Paracoccus pantotrophus TaxID=82367 RepID=UPI0008ED5A30|nr:citrate:proton symporter [Paracoccus pantotrophus]MDF3856238.1 citrate:proton symporter [Paracoccus pantotrophus]SFP02592.1 citrate-Mg2+:H+ or citrate-Ca2+:H+ symporter, CitMHS family [Paracoccus pantotrophus]
MLTFLGFATIVAFLAATLSGRVSVLAALVLIPLVAGLLGGFGADLGQMMMDGIVKVAPTGIMIMFAVLFFGLMLGTGIFNPMILGLARLIHGDPVRLCLVTAALAMLVALDGDGATTFLITVTAMLPVHRALKMNPLVLPGVVALAAGVMNLLPWGGPTARVMSLMAADSAQVFQPLIVPLAAGIAWVFVASALIGLGERRRLGVRRDFDARGVVQITSAEDEHALRPNLFWFNVALTLAVLATLFLHLLPLAAIFIIAFCIALVVNYPKWEDQKARLTAHADSVIVVTTMIFAAGIFTGILGGTGMIDAMAQGFVAIMPERMSGALPQIVAVASMPLSLAFTPDAFYFGILPVLTAGGEAMGHEGLEVARAALLGQMTTGFPLSPLTASTFILIGLSGVSLGDHQRFIFKWAFMTTVAMTVVATLTGVI